MEERYGSIFDDTARFITVYSSGCFHCFDCGIVCESKREKELRANIQRCVLRLFYGTSESSQLVLRRNKIELPEKEYLGLLKTCQSIIFVRHDWCKKCHTDGSKIFHAIGEIIFSRELELRA